MGLALSTCIVMVFRHISWYLRNTFGSVNMYIGFCVHVSKTAARMHSALAGVHHLKKHDATSLSPLDFGDQVGVEPLSRLSPIAKIISPPSSSPLKVYDSTSRRGLHQA